MSDGYRDDGTGTEDWGVTRITDQITAWPQEPQMAYHHAETGVWYWERLRTTAEALRELLQDHQHRKHDCGDEWCPVADARAVLAQLEQEGLA